MRVSFLFLFLLLANGLLYLWQSYFVNPVEVGQMSLPVDVPELVLLEETGTTVHITVVASIEPSVPETPIDESLNNEFIDNSEPFTPQAKNCYTVGPFVDGDALEKVKLLFADNKIVFEQRSFTEPELFGYNVFLPPLANRDAAVAMVAVLIDKGVTDYYIIQDTELKNAISLGLFREYRFAVRHVKLLEKKGLSPRMDTKYYDRTRHWVDFTEEEFKIDETALVNLSPESDVQRLLRACE